MTDYASVVGVFVGILAILIWIFLSGVAGVIAENKGLWSWGYLIASLLLSPLIGIILALVVEENIVKVENKKIASGVYKRCPKCVELVRMKAKVCRYCNFNFTHD